MPEYTSPIDKKRPLQAGHAIMALYGTIVKPAKQNDAPEEQIKGTHLVIERCTGSTVHYEFYAFNMLPNSFHSFLYNTQWETCTAYAASQYAAFNESFLSKLFPDKTITGLMPHEKKSIKPQALKQLSASIQQAVINPHQATQYGSLTAWHRQLIQALQTPQSTGAMPHNARSCSSALLPNTVLEPDETVVAAVCDKRSKNIGDFGHTFALEERFSPNNTVTLRRVDFFVAPTETSDFLLKKRKGMLSRKTITCSPELSAWYVEQVLLKAQPKHFKLAGLRVDDDKALARYQNKVAHFLAHPPAYWLSGGKTLANKLAPASVENSASGELPRNCASLVFVDLFEECLGYEVQKQDLVSLVIGHLPRYHQSTQPKQKQHNTKKCLVM